MSKHVLSHNIAWLFSFSYRRIDFLNSLSTAWNILFNFRVFRVFEYLQNTEIKKLISEVFRTVVLTWICFSLVFYLMFFNFVVFIHVATVSDIFLSLRVILQLSLSYFLNCFVLGPELHMVLLDSLNIFHVINNMITILYTFMSRHFYTCTFVVYVSKIINQSIKQLTLYYVTMRLLLVATCWWKTINQSIN